VASADAEHLEQRIARLERQEQRLVQAVELLVQREGAPRGRRRRDWDALAAVIASFIGLLALVVSGYTAYVQREQLSSQSQQLRAQVWPHLERSYNNTGDVGMFITNKGAGPARVIAMRVAVDDRPVSRWGDVQKAMGYSRGEGIIISQIGQTWIPAGTVLAFLRPDHQERSLSKFRELLPGGKHSLEVMLCYCSVLDECWVIGSGLLWESNLPGPPESCPITVDDRFLD
jgi:hypothetical protein